jgi:FtsP/CotA-like multicopper oxidase with cupredoxin domain
MVINGSIPGPTIIGDWGDYFKIHVTNALTQSTNGTSIHFHGIRQNYTNQNDGVVSITQCPVAPGSSITYEWRATQYGSTWYHSHFGLQAWEGVFGGILINGPASANYDVDLGHMFLNDWDHQTADELYISAETNGGVELDTGLLNGTNVYGDDGDPTQTGYRWNTTLTEGTTYRMRLVNAAIDTHWKFSIDNHTIGVIAMDLVPIVPYNTTTLSIGMGQRYDIIIYTEGMTEIATDFWMRAIPQSACSDNTNPENIKGIISYGTTVSIPATAGYNYTDSCDDEDASTLVPYLKKTVSGSQWDVDQSASVSKNDQGYFRWYLNSTTMQVEWSDPTLAQIYNSSSNSTITTWDKSDAVITLDESNRWAYAVIETNLTVPHPIHLHGFDFFVLAQGPGTYSPETTTLKLDNPPRRDTAMLPATGYLAIAFETDNPGAWLMHCHIGWHISEGFAMQWIVRQDEIKGLVDYGSLESTCAAWDTYAAAHAVVEDDSGV